MPVYLDLVVLLNFLVDMMLLTGTNCIAGHPSDIARVSAGAALGGIYAGICLLPGFRFLGNLLWRSVSLGLMGWLSFGSGPGLLRKCSLFVLLSMALGGTVLGLGAGGVPGLLAAAVVLWLMCQLGFLGKSAGQRIIPVKLEMFGKTVAMKALHDTGNTLRDPITGCRILVAGPDVAELLLGLSIRELQDPAGTMASSQKPGLRLIPYRAVGQSCGLLLGISVKNAKIGKNRENIVVAFTDRGIGEGQDEFNALIGGEL